MSVFSVRFLSSRTNCVIPRFLTSEETTNYPNSQDVESYWMETSCPKETIEFFPMDNLKKLCENPGNYNFLEAHLPVSDAYTAVHYRNVFCAFCWNIGPMQLEQWQLEVHCHKRLEVSDRDILTETKNKKCNIFYRPSFQYGLSYACKSSNMLSCFSYETRQSCVSTANFHFFVFNRPLLIIISQYYPMKASLKPHTPLGYSVH